MKMFTKLIKFLICGSRNIEEELEEERMLDKVIIIDDDTEGEDKGYDFESLIPSIVPPSIPHPEATMY